MKFKDGIPGCNKEFDSLFECLAHMEQEHKVNPAKLMGLFTAPIFEPKTEN